MNYAWWTMYIIDLNRVELKYPLMISVENVMEFMMSYHQKYVFLKK